MGNRLQASKPDRYVCPDCHIWGSRQKIRVWHRRTSDASKPVWYRFTCT